MEEVTEEMASKAEKYMERYTSRLDRLETRDEDTKANIEEMKARVKVCEEAIEKYKESHCKPEEAEAPIRVYWGKSHGDHSSYDDAMTMKDAERMKKELVNAGYYVDIIVKGK